MFFFFVEKKNLDPKNFWNATKKSCMKTIPKLVNKTFGSKFTISFRVRKNFSQGFKTFCNMFKKIFGTWKFWCNFFWNYTVGYIYQKNWSRGLNFQNHEILSKFQEIMKFHEICKFCEISEILWNFVKILSKFLEWIASPRIPPPPPPPGGVGGWSFLLIKDLMRKNWPISSSKL